MSYASRMLDDGQAAEVRTEDGEIRRQVVELRDGVAVEANSERLFKSSIGWVRGFFRRRGFPLQEAEDLAQEALFQALTGIASLKRPEQFRSWLFSIATNLYRNELRHRSRLKRQAREVPLEGDDGDSVLTTLAAPGEPPDRALVEDEQRQALARAVAGLPDQMRRCLVLRLGRDMKYREVAAVLKISIQTVKAHLFQARQRLQAELGDAFRDDEDG